MNTHTKIDSKAESFVDLEWSPESAFADTFAKHGDAWPYNLVHESKLFPDLEAAQAGAAGIGDKALHGHFSFREIANQPDEYGNPVYLTSGVIEVENGRVSYLHQESEA